MDIDATGLTGANITANYHMDHSVFIRSTASGVRLWNVTANNNSTYGLITHFKNAVTQNLEASGNITYLRIEASDVEIWNATVDMITDNGTRTRWNYAIAGSPLGGTDIRTLTGASVVITLVSRERPR